MLEVFHITFMNLAIFYEMIKGEIICISYDVFFVGFDMSSTENITLLIKKERECITYVGCKKG